MDRVGIDRRVILILDWGLELGEPETSIENLHREILKCCRQSSGRLIGYAGIDPRREAAVELLRRSLDDYGARGLKLHPTGGWRLDDARTLDLVSLAVTREVPVLVHIGATMDILSDKNCQPEALIKLARHFPKGKFVAGHSGFGLFTVFLEEKSPPRNLIFDISGWQELVGEDSALLSANLSSLLTTFPDRVCFGTDSPFYSYNLVAREKHWVEMVKACVEGLPGTLREAGRKIFACPALVETLQLGAATASSPDS